MTTTLQGSYALPSGRQATGTVLIEVDTEGQVIRDTEAAIVWQGPWKIRLVDGHFTVEIPSSDDPGLSPSGFTVTVTEQLDHVDVYRAVSFEPLDGQTVDVSDLLDGDEEVLTPTYANTTEATVSALTAASAAHYADHSNPHAVTKAQVGLPNVDNTSDVNKPVSTAQAAAIQAAISNLVAGAPGALDTLLELANQFATDESAATALTSLVGQIRNLTDAAALAALRSQVAGDIGDGASTIGVAVGDAITASAVVPVVVPAGGPVPDRPSDALAVEWVSDVNPEARMDDPDVWVPRTLDAALLDEAGAVALLNNPASALYAVVAALATPSKVFLAANRFRDTGATATSETVLGAGNGTKTPVRSFTTTVGSFSACTFDVPKGCNSFTAAPVIMAPTASTGEPTRWTVTSYGMTPGVSASTVGSTVGPVTINTGGQYVPVVGTIGTAIACVPGEVRRLTVSRTISSGDTYGQSVGLIGVLLTRVS